MCAAAPFRLQSRKANKDKQPHYHNHNGMSNNTKVRSIAPSLPDFAAARTVSVSGRRMASRRVDAKDKFCAISFPVYSVGSGSAGGVPQAGVI